MHKVSLEKKNKKKTTKKQRVVTQELRKGEHFMQLSPLGNMYMYFVRLPKYGKYKVSQKFNQRK